MLTARERNVQRCAGTTPVAARQHLKVWIISYSEMDSSLDKIVGEIVVAFLGQNPIAAADLPALVRNLRAAFNAEPLADNLTPPNTLESRPDQGNVSATPHQPAIPIEESIQEEFLISLEDGKRYRSLRRHLMAKYGMTPDEYRRKWQLPDDYPMVAPSYARERSEVAKRIGLGKTENKVGRKHPQGLG